jgi:hypothetical protein
MEKTVGAKQVYRQQGVGGQRDLDLVYQNGDIYYVVEAKAPSAAQGSRQVPGEFKAGEPVYAMQGSQRYLEDTINAMRASGNPESVRMA